MINTCFVALNCLIFMHGRQNQFDSRINIAYMTNKG